MPQLPLPSSKQLRKICEADGWVVKRTSGSHLIMTKDGSVRPIVIPLGRKQLSRDLFHSNLRTAEMSRDRYLKLFMKL